MHMLTLLILAVSVTTCLCDNSNVYITEFTKKDRSIEEPLLKTIRIAEKLPKYHLNLLLISKAVTEIDNTVCRDHIDRILSELNNYTKWAFEFYDSSAKLPNGILSGSTYEFGNFDECLNINSENDQDMPLAIKGKYCLAKIDFEYIQAPNKKKSIWSEFSAINEPKSRYDLAVESLNFGVCVPASCTAGNVAIIFEVMLNSSLNREYIVIKPFVDEKKCYENQPISIDTYDVIYLAFVTTIVLFVLLGTLYHAATYSKFEGSDRSEGLLSKILKAFSLISNLQKLCSHAHENDLNLSCISGIKFAAMSFIVAGHCLVFVLGGPILNKDFWQQASTKVENAIFLNNPLLVDTFLFLSGFLFARILLQELDKRKSINFLLLYIFRYIRLTPAYLVIIGLYATWLPKFDSGPLWSRMIVEKERCQHSWWTNLIYINNYVNTDQLCMFQSWYLSVDTQLFILAPSVIYPLWRWRKVGELILLSVTGLSVVIPFTMTLVNRLDPTLMIYIREIHDVSTNNYFKNAYIKTHMRASAYCFGLIFGYILYRIQTSDYKFSRLSVRIYWIFGSLSLIISMFSITIFYGIQKDFTIFEAAIYSALHRVLWSLGTGWIIIACVTNNSGPVCRFLRWKPFVPLSRLTYCAYLVNGLIELHSISTIRTPQYLDTITLFAKVMSHLVMTFAGAVILSTMFEGPILGLERIFLRPVIEASKSPNNHQNTTSTET